MDTSEYIAALTEVMREVMQIRRLTEHLRDRSSSRRHFASEMDIGQSARKTDSAKDLEIMAANLLEIAREIPPGAERHNALKQIGKPRIKLDVLVSKQKELPRQLT
jgi:hypothetical protein